MTLYLQIGQAIPTSPMELVTNSTGATKVVLAILIVLSLISWAIIFGKGFELRRALRVTHAFARDFAGVPTLDRAGQLGRQADRTAATTMDPAMRFTQETTPSLQRTAERFGRC